MSWTTYYPRDAHVASYKTISIYTCKYRSYASSSFVLMVVVVVNFSSDVYAYVFEESQTVQSQSVYLTHISLASYLWDIDK